MGGGDLNLKKSWHPSTLRNIERVWKAEQKHEVEKQKIEQLQKELAEERAREEIQAYAEDQGVVKKKEERLDWMYQGPAAMVNREEYLLGRKIDKTLELLEQQENGKEPSRDDFDVGATMFSSQDLSGTATVDLANKIREDPLFSIMKKEKEQRKNLLCNPVKMKQLQQLLQESLGKKKHKKSKKNKKCLDSDSGEKKHYKKQKKEKYSKESESEYSGKSSRLEAIRDHKSKNKKSSHDNVDRRSSSSDWKEYISKHSSDKYSHSNHKNKLWDNSNSSKSYDSRERNSHNSRSRERDFNTSVKRKLDTEEREHLLKEMQENAKWREVQRERKVRCYKDEEEQEARANKLDASDFIKPILSKAAGKGSLENRVKQKIFSIQRKSSDMNRHFVRR